MIAGRLAVARAPLPPDALHKQPGSPVSYRDFLDGYSPSTTLPSTTLWNRSSKATPKAEIRLEGRKVIRGDVTNDWGLRLQWEVRRDGKVVATPAARAETSYEHPDATPGKYEIVLQMWKYVELRARTPTASSPTASSSRSRTR